MSIIAPAAALLLISLPAEIGETPPTMPVVDAIQTAPVTTQPTPDDHDEITVSGDRTPPGDPLAKLNEDSWGVTQAVDGAFVAPVAMAYKDAVPTPVRTGLRNFLNNLREPVVFVNFLLQGKPGKAVETVGRFAVNSTIGVVGLVDVAKKKPFYLPRRPNGFANTLGFYGVRPGPFLFLPIVGPTTLRDLIGGGIDRLVLPTAVGEPFTRLEYSIPTGIIAALDHRIEFDDELQEFRVSGNPYANARTYYLERRQAEIDHLRGRDRKPLPVVTVAPAVTVTAPAPEAPTTAVAPEIVFAPLAPVVQPLPAGYYPPKARK